MKCKICGNAEELYECSECDGVICQDCAETCDKCGSIVCIICDLETCDKCGDNICARCMAYSGQPDLVICDFCLEDD